MVARFDGQVAWITGGGTGLGRFMALELARQGARVAVSGRRANRLDEVVAAITAEGGEAVTVVCDVTDEDAVEQAATQVAKHYGQIDVVVANAGFSVGGRVEHLTFADWRLQMDVNVGGCAITAAKAIPHLRTTKGRLALVGSVASHVHFEKAGPYQASKAAVWALGNTLSLELARDAISVTTIHPGFVKSEINQVDNQGNHNPDRADKRPKNLLWETEDAARVMVNAIYRRRGQFVFTGHGRFGWFMAQHFPWLVHWIAGRVSNNTK
jgi:NAD(P)-dependent dehydrogenase (short-subunit alcohol dehydrogenase family)